MLLAPSKEDSEAAGGVLKLSVSGACSRIELREAWLLKSETNSMLQTLKYTD